MSPRQAVILKVLSAGPASPIELRTNYGRQLGNPSQPSLSQSLRLMKAGGLVVSHGSGMHVFYSITPKGRRALP